MIVRIEGERVPGVMQGTLRMWAARGHRWLYGTAVIHRLSVTAGNRNMVSVETMPHDLGLGRQHIFMQYHLNEVLGSLMSIILPKTLQVQLSKELEWEGV